VVAINSVQNCASDRLKRADVMPNDGSPPKDAVVETNRSGVRDLGEPVNQSTGVLSIQVSTSPIVAGTRATVTLFIRNPFPDDVVIQSIEAPSSEPLLPRLPGLTAESDSKTKSFFQSFVSSLSSAIKISEISAGPLVARFPGESTGRYSINLEPTSKLLIKSRFNPGDRVDINAQQGAEVIYEAPPQREVGRKPGEERTIPVYQDDIASFELCTAHWLFVRPKTLDLYAVIRYRLAGGPRSQVVPFSVYVQPPLKAVVCGSVFGGILGYFARVLVAAQTAAQSVTFATFFTSATIVPVAISVLGIMVMCFILAIVLSRQENTKGFVTLEDFYGAFVVGVLLGYTGTSYFEGLLKSIASTHGT
jgi:hypothetical protein